MEINFAACCEYAESIAKQLSDWSDTFGNGGAVTCHTNEVKVTDDNSNFLRNVLVTSWIILEDEFSETFIDQDTGEEDDGTRRLVVLVAHGDKCVDCKVQLFDLAMTETVACKEDYLVILPDCALAYVAYDYGVADIYTLQDTIKFDNYPELELNISGYKSV